MGTASIVRSGGIVPGTQRPCRRISRLPSGPRSVFAPRRSVTSGASNPTRSNTALSAGAEKSTGAAAVPGPPNPARKRGVRTHAHAESPPAIVRRAAGRGGTIAQQRHGIMHVLDYVRESHQVVWPLRQDPGDSIAAAWIVRPCFSRAIWTERGSTSTPSTSHPRARIRAMRSPTPQPTSSSRPHRPKPVQMPLELIHPRQPHPGLPDPAQQPHRPPPFPCRISSRLW